MYRIFVFPTTGHQNQICFFQPLALCSRADLIVRVILCCSLNVGIVFATVPLSPTIVRMLALAASTYIKATLDCRCIFFFHHIQQTLCSHVNNSKGIPTTLLPPLLHRAANNQRRNEVQSPFPFPFLRCFFRTP